MGGFLAKLATNRIGSRAVFWDLVGYAIVAVSYSAAFYQPSKMLTDDKVGIAIAVLAGAVGSTGGVAFYLLMAKKDASTVVPLTALYPALTAVLAILFLREQVTIQKIIGIGLALAASVLLTF